MPSREKTKEGLYEVVLDMLGNDLYGYLEEAENQEDDDVFLIPNSPEAWKERLEDFYRYQAVKNQIKT